ncbi:hypothetical protein B0T18DRAFT_242986 [Schizothecium vesticola]|uniref:Secreted protein n=1 Tax=Schizothecium vesticola TaxID=314040 RepID=A0AA40BQC3_9PEZI|nr:hypothetical protein B0T18DRAFT_242986 [Schizothecium vesticola]
MCLVFPREFWYFVFLVTLGQAFPPVSHGKRAVSTFLSEARSTRHCITLHSIEQWHRITNMHVHWALSLCFSGERRARREVCQLAWVIKGVEKPRGNSGCARCRYVFMVMIYKVIVSRHFSRMMHTPLPYKGGNQSKVLSPWGTRSHLGVLVLIFLDSRAVRSACLPALTP